MTADGTVSGVDDLLSALRARAADRRRLATEHPNLDAETVAAIRHAPKEVMGSADQSVPYDPTRYLWSAREVLAEYSDECRECYEPRQYPRGQRHFGWALWRTCDPGCSHVHHADEVWIA